MHIDNTHPNAFYNLGKILYLLEDYSASKKTYKSAYERGMVELMGNTHISAESFYINLGHTLLYSNNINGEYSDVIKEYN